MAFGWRTDVLTTQRIATLINRKFSKRTYEKGRPSCVMPTGSTPVALQRANLASRDR
jgi:hypothetical protein